MSKIIPLLIIVAAAILFASLYNHPSFSTFFRVEPTQPLITFNDQTPLRVTVVDEDGERRQGLSGKTSLGETEGMLFVFPDDGFHGIWMKDMKFSIDIIWVDEDGKVVGIVSSARPDSYPRIFEPEKPARYVIETNAHFAETFGIAVGSTVQFKEALQ